MISVKNFIKVGQLVSIDVYNTDACNWIRGRTDGQAHAFRQEGFKGGTQLQFCTFTKFPRSFKWFAWSVKRWWDISFHWQCHTENKRNGFESVYVIHSVQRVDVRSWIAEGSGREVKGGYSPGDLENGDFGFEFRLWL